MKTSFHILPVQTPSSLRCKNFRSSKGSASVEMVLLAPLFMVVTLFVVSLGRSGGAAQQVRHAADVAARAASTGRLDHVSGTANSAARADLVNNGVNCASVAVHTSVSQSPNAASVTVTVTCQVNQSGLALLGVDDHSVSASSTEVIDKYRGG